MLPNALFSRAPVVSYMLVTAYSYDAALDLFIHIGRNFGNNGLVYIPPQTFTVLGQLADLCDHVVIVWLCHTYLVQKSAWKSANGSG